MTDAQLIALVALLFLVAVLVLGEMFDRAIRRDLEERDSYDAAHKREKEDRR